MNRIRALVAACVVSAVAIGLGVWLLSPKGQTPAPAAPETTQTASPQGFNQVDIDLPVERAQWCDRLDESEIEDALDGPVVETETYGVGDQVPVGRAADVSGEYGCIYTSDRGAIARTWVFAPPVSPQLASEFKVDALGAPGCQTLDALKFGTNAVGLGCASKNFRLISFRGLFGDAWLACSLRADPKIQGLIERAEAWCAHVAFSASAG